MQIKLKSSLSVFVALMLAYTGVHAKSKEQASITEQVVVQAEEAKKKAQEAAQEQKDNAADMVASAEAELEEIAENMMQEGANLSEDITASEATR